MAKDIDDPKSVDAFIQKLDPNLAKLIEATRQLILSSDIEIGQQIKWNSPSFFFKGEMKAFNPKEYKRDIVVMNIRKGNVLLVLPTGATVQDTSGILEGDYKDGRRLVTFSNLEDVQTRGPGLQQVIRLWLAQVEK